MAISQSSINLEPTGVDAALPYSIIIAVARSMGFSTFTTHADAPIGRTGSETDMYAPILQASSGLWFLGKIENHGTVMLTQEEVGNLASELNVVKQPHPQMNSYIEMAERIIDTADTLGRGSATTAICEILHKAYGRPPGMAETLSSIAMEAAIKKCLNELVELKMMKEVAERLRTRYERDKSAWTIVEQNALNGLLEAYEARKEKAWAWAKDLVS